MEDKFIWSRTRREQCKY